MAGLIAVLQEPDLHGANPARGRAAHGLQSIPEECNGVCLTSCLNRVGSMLAVGRHGGGIMSA